MEFWRTGEDTYAETNSKERGFSENKCGARTAEYMVSISGLSDRAWEKIQSEAATFISKTHYSSGKPLDLATTTHRAHFFEVDSD